MPDTPSAAMIFAAGFGTRMRPLTNDRPKPMVHVAGAPMIDRALSMVSDAGLSRVVCNLHYMPEVLQSHLSGREVQTLVEVPDILDTGGGLRNALPLLEATIVVTVNPDAIWHGPNPVEVALSKWDADKMDALLVCVPPHHAHGTTSSGDFTLNADGSLTRGPGALYGGVQIMRTDRLQDIPEKVFSLNRLWDVMIAEQTLFGCTYPGQWCDVGHPEGIKIAEDMIGWPPDA